MPKTHDKIIYVVSLKRGINEDTYQISFGVHLHSLLPWKGPVMKTQGQGKIEKTCSFTDVSENVTPSRTMKDSEYDKLCRG